MFASQKCLLKSLTLLIDDKLNEKGTIKEQSINIKEQMWMKFHRISMKNSARVLSLFEL